MTLNLIQLISGTATFAEPERPITEATKGMVVSIPEAEWIKSGCPSALVVSTFPGVYENAEKIAESVPEADTTDPRFYL